VVIGGAQPFYEQFFHLTTPSEIGWAMSSALIDCRQGAIASGVLSDKFGRKRLLMGANQLTIVIGVLSAQVMNWLIARPVPAGITGLEILNSRNGQMGWRWMFGGTAVPAPLFLLAVRAVPESPHWLAKNGQFDRARAILGRLGGPALASLETENIQRTLAKDVERVDFRELLEPKMVRILGLGIFLAVFQQSCGINVVFNYAQEVFAAAGYQVSGILFNST
jgi:SP family arabinose:H+ symporter-like MFS transporter